jgi:hypothetical protein
MCCAIYYRYGDIVPSTASSRGVICLLIVLGIITVGYFAAIFSELLADKLQRQTIKRNKRVVAFLAGVGKARNEAIERARSKTGLFRYLIKK